MQTQASVVAGVLLALGAVMASAETLYVSPTGRDTWSGRIAKANAAKTDGPLASLNGARDAIRQLRARGPLSAPVHVVVAGGTYTLREPVVFTPGDSGEENAPITYEAAPGAHPVFNGGQRITGWKQGANGVWTASVPEVKSGAWYFEQLWVEGRRGVRARTPNKFYSYMAEKAGHGIDPQTGKMINLGATAFIARPQDIKPLLGLSPQELHDVTLVALDSWEASRLRIASVNGKTNTVYTTGPTKYNFMWWGPNERYWLENFRSALDAPGEWFLSRDGEISYLPRPGEKMAGAEVIAPRTEQFVRFEGSPTEKVQYITLRGLDFRYGQHVLEPQGHSDTQAEVTVPAMIMADGAHHVAIEDCEIGHVGIYGIWFRRACTDCRIAHCYLHDLGAGGIKIGEGGAGPNAENQTGHITADNNIVQSGGLIFLGSIGVWIGDSGDNSVTHNDIGDFRYTGVSVGWSWGYGPSQAVRNTISYNHIHNIGWGVLSDMGGVYTLGVSTGSVVSNNVIHDVYSYDKYGRGGWGLYNDEGTSYMTLENNLVHHTKTGGYHQHYGRENQVRNNIFAFSMDGQLQRSRVENFIPFFFEHNLVYWNGGGEGAGPLFAGVWTDANMRIDHNLYWDTSGKPIVFQGMDFDAWQKTGKDVDSVVADPGFADPAHDDYSLKADSPALQIGFKPFDYHMAGVYGAREWVALAKQATYPPVEFAPEPPPLPPLTFHLNFDELPVGVPCPLAQNNVEGKGDSIAVSDEEAFSGTHSLKITDAPGLANAYDPNLAFLFTHTEGVTTFRFALRAGPGVVMYHEWRDWRTQPYKAGPSLWIAGGKLQVNGQTLAEIPADRWIQFEVTAGIGKDSDGTWELKVTPAGGETRRFAGLKNVSGKLEALTWAGFSSMATEKTVFYLDDLDLHNSTHP